MTFLNFIFKKLTNFVTVVLIIFVYTSPFHPLILTYRLISRWKKREREKSINFLSVTTTSIYSTRIINWHGHLSRNEKNKTKTILFKFNEPIKKTDPRLWLISSREEKNYCVSFFIFLFFLRQFFSPLFFSNNNLHFSKWIEQIRSDRVPILSSRSRFHSIPQDPNILSQSIKIDYEKNLKLSLFFSFSSLWVFGKHSKISAFYFDNCKL